MQQPLLLLKRKTIVNYNVSLCFTVCFTVRLTALHSAVCVSLRVSLRFTAQRVFHCSSKSLACYSSLLLASQLANGHVYAVINSCNPICNMQLNVLNDLAEAMKALDGKKKSHPRTFSTQKANQNFQEKYSSFCFTNHPQKIIDGNKYSSDFRCNKLPSPGRSSATTSGRQSWRCQTSLPCSAIRQANRPQSCSAAFTSRCARVTSPVSAKKHPGISCSRVQGSSCQEITISCLCL